MKKINTKVLVTLQILWVLPWFFGLNSCKEDKKAEVVHEETALQISDSLKWYERMALSETVRFPDPTLLDFQEKSRWSYTNGLVLQAMSRVYEKTENTKLYDYIYEYADRMIDSSGTISTYRLDTYNLDMIKSGDAILWLQQNKAESRFKIALDSLHKQLVDQPTTSEGGYWHKKRYPYQMWLDGVFMAEPWHTKYVLEYIEDPKKQADWLDKIVLQFDLIEKHNRDSQTGLYYHGWDESRAQKWADDKTGLSPNFWSRGMGWYGMALVDVLDHLPETHPGRERIIKYLQQYVKAIVKVQDQSGAWWQVLNMPQKKGNYLEATGTCMFTYVLAKGVNKKYISEAYRVQAEKAFQSILDLFITVDKNGLVSLNKCCGVAGLGGNPYRDGSFEYYVNEIIRSNDPKGTGPFMFAALELNK